MGVDFAEGTLGETDFGLSDLAGTDSFLASKGRLGGVIRFVLVLDGRSSSESSPSDSSYSEAVSSKGTSNCGGGCAVSGDFELPER